MSRKKEIDKNISDVVTEKSIRDWGETYKSKSLNFNANNKTASHQNVINSFVDGDFLYDRSIYEEYIKNFNNYNFNDFMNDEEISYYNNGKLNIGEPSGEMYNFGTNMVGVSSKEQHELQSYEDNLFWNDSSILEDEIENSDYYSDTNCDFNDERDVKLYYDSIIRSFEYHNAYNHDGNQYSFLNDDHFKQYYEEIVKDRYRELIETKSTYYKDEFKMLSRRNKGVLENKNVIDFCIVIDFPKEDDGKSLTFEDINVLDKKKYFPYISDEYDSVAPGYIENRTLTKLFKYFYKIAFGNIPSYNYYLVNNFDVLLQFSFNDSKKEYLAYVDYIHFCKFIYSLKK